MNWHIFEHYAVAALAIAVIVIGVLWHWERKECSRLRDEIDEGFEEIIRLEGELDEAADDKAQLRADLDACRDQHVTKAASRPLEAPEVHPSPRERFKPKPQ